MKIGLACDHGGYKLKEKIKKYLESIKIETVDYGTNSLESVDYPDYAHKLCDGINSKEVDFGIAICSTGIGISIACNKVKGIRCATVRTIEDVKMTRNDNNANIIAISEKTDIKTALKLVDTMVNTPFAGIDRYKRRINKMRDYEDSK